MRGRSAVSKYAQTTKVPVDRSRAEIETILERYGSDGFAYASMKGRAMIEFMAHNRRIKFIVDLPDAGAQEFTLTPTGKARAATAAREAYETAVRQRWRSLTLLVKAKLEAVESGIESFEDEFMPHTVLPSGRTVAEEMQPQIERAYTSGTVAPLQIEGGHQ